MLNILDKSFELFIPGEEIDTKISLIADRINEDYRDKEPLLLPILNGAFMFTSDLIKKLEIRNRLSFIKLASYVDTSSTGIIKTILGLSENVEDKDIIVVEDIVDTGNTMTYLMDKLNEQKPRSLEVATLFIKFEKYQSPYSINYHGFKIPDHFIVGYGMDYNGYGRNLKDVYKLQE